MDSKQLISTKRVTKISGVSGKTLKLYSDASLIDSPTFESHGRGGASLYWPKNILIQLSLIKSLKASGKSLPEIQNILTGDK
jgi:DNA-binding transcriptional MerR regulator